MSAETLAQAARRIAQHVDAHGIADIDVIFHGGEPLLAGIDWLVWARDVICEALPKKTTPHFGMQTNGLLLDASVLDRLLAARIAFGISLDGPREVNDRHRVDRRGGGTHDRVAHVLELLATHPALELFTGFLAVVDVDAEPGAVLEYFAGKGAKRLDFLLPHGHWDRLPPGMTHPREGRYGSWLIRAFDSWYEHYSEIRVRLFADMIKLFFGGGSVVESLGLEPKSLIVVESDGAIEAVDTLRSVAEGETSLGFHVRPHSFDDAISHPRVRARYVGEQALAPACRSCRYVSICGGGYLPHRWSGSRGYDNPSVFCHDLYRLCQHVETRLRDDLRLTA